MIDIKIEDNKKNESVVFTDVPEALSNIIFTMLENWNNTDKQTK